MSKYPWRVSADELQVLRGNGGQSFTDFVNTLLRKEAHRARIPLPEVRTNLRVNVGDEGVDAAVDKPLGGGTGIDVPSCWQFKATSFAEVTPAALRVEVNKAEARRLIASGYGYYVCVCDDWPPNKVTALGEELRAVVQQINPAAPSRILPAGELAEWARRHVSVLVEFFRPSLREAIPHAQWLRVVREDIPKFVEVPARASATKAILEHVALEEVPSPMLSIAGPGGAGASRFVSEVLAGEDGRVIYAAEAVAGLKVATSLVNDSDLTSVLVVDQCSLREAERIQEVLKGESRRIRAIAILRPDDGGAKAALRLDRLDDADVHRVMDANFPGVPPSHRRAFVSMADGILKVAAYLASAYVASPERSLTMSTQWAEDEVNRLVSDRDDRRVLASLALFSRVGHAGHAAAQLSQVCSLCALDRNDVMRRCRRLAQAQGVVALRSLYIKVRPRLFARSLFETAWAECMSPDAESKLDGLAPALQLAVVKQVGAHGSPNARETVAAWGFKRLGKLGPATLANARSAELLLALVDVQPDLVGPQLTELVEALTDEEARSGGASFNGWPARMWVVWKLRDLLNRRATYALSETALYRLAEAEGEPNVVGERSGTATATWADSFRLLLSGTEIPFVERAARLGSRLDDRGAAAVPLVITALGRALSPFATKMEGLPVVGGELRPTDWQPKTYGELRESLAAGVTLLARCMAAQEDRRATFEVLSRNGRGLLHRGCLLPLRAVLDPLQLCEAERLVVLGFVDDFLTYDAPKAEGDALAYVADVRKWAGELGRKDLPGRLLEALSLRSHRRYFGAQEEWAKEMNGLGAELFANPSEFSLLLPSLAGDGLHGGGLFAVGQAMGRLDADAGLLSEVVRSTASQANSLLARGYVLGLAEQGERHDARLAAELTTLEAANPAAAIELNATNSRAADVSARAIRLVRERRLPPDSIGRMFVLASEYVADAVEAVFGASAQAEDAAATSLRILGRLAYTSAEPIPADERTRAAIWRTLEAAVLGAHAEGHAWGRLLRRMVDIDFDRAVRLACEATIRGEFSVQDEAAAELSVYIGLKPDVVLEALGPILLDPKESWRFAIGRRGAVVNGFPPAMLQEWIRAHGRAAALVVAPHLSPPYVDAEGRIHVPPLTQFVMTEFETDDEVRSTFCSGGHDFQLYSGDIAGQRENEAAAAEKFRTHEHAWVRWWANEEIRTSRRDAAWWREQDEEYFDE